MKAVLQVRPQLLPAANRIHRLLKQGNCLRKIVRSLLVHRFQNLYAEFGLSRRKFQCAQGQGGTNAGTIVTKCIGEQGPALRKITPATRQLCLLTTIMRQQNRNGLPYLIRRIAPGFDQAAFGQQLLRYSAGRRPVTLGFVYFQQMSARHPAVIT